MAIFTYSSVEMILATGYVIHTETITLYIQSSSFKYTKSLKYTVINFYMIFSV